MRYLSILILLSIASCKDNNDKNIKAQSKDITEYVYASVKVKPLISYYPQPIRSGIIKKIYVDEGQVIKKGDILFEVSLSAELRGQMTNAEIDLEEAKSNYIGNNNLLNNLRLEIQNSKKQLSLDSINYIRQSNLWSQNVGKKIDYDQAKLKYQTALTQVNILNQKLVQSRTNLLNNYKKAKTKTEREKSQLLDFIIVSEIDGKVYTIEKEEGDFISTQERFGEIGSANDYIIEMDIDEVDITKIEKGDSVLISLDAYPNEVYLSNISKIYPKKNDLTLTFKVESKFKEKPIKLYNGLAGEGNIIISKRFNTLVIPTEYLISNNKVLTKKGEKNIEVGLKNLKFVEVISGIDSTTVIIKPSE